MPSPNLILGGVEVPRAAGLRISQSYEAIGGFTVLRMMSGAALKQTHWVKLRTSIKGDGWIPAGLQGIDYSGPLSLACIGPRAINSSSAEIILPAARRADAPPFAFAILGNGSLANTDSSLAGDTLTITPVAGAAGYSAHYFPLLSVIAAAPTENYDASGRLVGWELSAEEV